MSDGAGVFHPERIGSYRIDRLIGQGGMGMVFAATGEEGQEVAIKVAMGLDARARVRFLREVTAVRRLKHPGIVRVHDAGFHQDQPWYAMDRVGSLSLAELLACHGPQAPHDLPALITGIGEGRLLPCGETERRPLPVSVAIDLVADLCRAVAHAHERGLIHRDLKPANVLLTAEGRPVICDFGLVADRQLQARLTATGDVVGSLGYTAPEGRSPRAEVDERVDVFALGAILRELLTGQPPPLAGVAAPLTTASHKRQAHVLRVLPRRLRAILHRAVHPVTHRRYISVQALLADLERYRHGAPILARFDPWPLRLAGWGRRYLWPVTAVAVLMVGLGGLGLWRWWRHSLEESRWARAPVHLDLADGRDCARLMGVAGGWRQRDGGLAPENDGVAVFDRRYFGPVRIRARIQLNRNPPHGVGVFVADFKGTGRDGYRFELMPAAAPWALLWRCEDVLWAGPWHPRERAQVILGLELVDGMVSARVDGQVVAEVIDERPLYGGSVGVRLRAGGQHGVLTGLTVRPRSLPYVRAPVYLGRRLVALMDAVPDDSARALWGPMAATLEELHHRRPLTDVTFARLAAEALGVLGRMPMTTRPPMYADSATLATAIHERLAALPGAGRDLAWHLLRLRLLLDLEPTRHEDLFAPLAAIWRGDAAARPAIVRALLARGMQVPHCWTLAARLDQNHPATTPARALLAHRLLAEVLWHAPARDWALDRLTAASAGELSQTALRCRAWRAATGPVADTAALIGLDGGTAWRAYLALGLDVEQHDRAADRSWWRVASLVLAREPAMRFDGAALAGLDPPAAERAWLAATSEELLPPATAWRVSALADPTVAEAYRACLQGVGDLQTVARAVAARGEDPRRLPWGRMVAAALALDPHNDGLRHCLVACIDQAVLDVWALGLVWRELRGWRPEARLVSACGDELVPLVRALRGERSLAGVRVPAWHPSRPLLQLVLALAAQAQGDADLVREHLDSLAEGDVTWPEALAAKVLRERTPTP